MGTVDMSIPSVAMLFARIRLWLVGAKSKLENFRPHVALSGKVSQMMIFQCLVQPTAVYFVAM
jgi:hypothetical protein